MASAQSDADAAYAGYQASTQVDAGQAYRDQVQELDNQTQTLGIAMGVTSALAAGALSTAIYLFMEAPELAPPGGQTTHLTPWLTNQSGGLGLHTRF